MFTAKKQKKITRILNSHEDHLNALMREKVYEWFAIFCLSVLFDRIGEIFKLYAVLRYDKVNIGPLQLIIATIALIQMFRYSQRIKK